MTDSLLSVKGSNPIAFLSITQLFLYTIVTMDASPMHVDIMSDFASLSGLNRALGGGLKYQRDAFTSYVLIMLSSIL